MKNLAIIGSTGSTGKEVVKLAQKTGFKITVIERNPDFSKLTGDLKVVKGDVTNLKSLVTAFKNIDFVISCFGPTEHRKVGTLMSVGTTNIVKACEQNGVKKLVFMSGFVQSDGDELSWLNRIAIKLLRIYYSQSYSNKVIAESAVQNAAIDWCIVRAVALKHGSETGTYEAGVESKVSPFNALTYADCAKCLLDAIEEKAWENQIINVGKG